MDSLLKLNLGCGQHHREGYINVDKYGSPDILHDLETFPWPWRDNSVKEILLYHVLEHLGQAESSQLIEKAVIDAVSHMPSLSAGKMGHTTSEVGDMVVSYIQNQ